MKKESINYHDYPESDVVVNHIYKRFQRGLYTLVLVIGLPGGGKSSTCLRLCELVSEKIHDKIELTEKCIIDSSLELIDFVRNAKPGDVGVIEEMSVLFPSRRAMASENVDVARVLDTCRKKQVILFANAPILKSIDSHIRALANVSIETLKIVKGQGVVVYKPLRLQTQPKSGKTYNHRFTRDGYEVHRSYVKKPNDELWKVYEKKKDDFMDTLYEKLKGKQMAKEMKEKKEMIKNGEIDAPKQLHPDKIFAYQEVIMKGTSMREAARNMNRSRATISRWVKEVQLSMRVANS